MQQKFSGYLLSRSYKNVLPGSKRASRAAFVHLNFSHGKRRSHKNIELMSIQSSHLEGFGCTNYKRSISSVCYNALLHQRNGSIRSNSIFRMFSTPVGKDNENRKSSEKTEGETKSEMKVKLILENDYDYDDLDSKSSIPKGKKRKIIMLKKNNSNEKKLDAHIQENDSVVHFNENYEQISSITLDVEENEPDLLDSFDSAHEDDDEKYPDVIQLNEDDEFLKMLDGELGLEQKKKGTKGKQNGKGQVSQEEDLMQQRIREATVFASGGEINTAFDGYERKTKKEILEEEKNMKQQRGQSKLQKNTVRPQPQQEYKIVMDLKTCPGCGNRFQSKNEISPGYLPQDVYNRIMHRIELLNKEQQKTSTSINLNSEHDLFEGISVEEEIEELLTQVKSGQEKKKDAGNPNYEDNKIELNDAQLSHEDNEEKNVQNPELLSPTMNFKTNGKVDKYAHLKKNKSISSSLHSSGNENNEEEKVIICQRCHKLKHYGAIDDKLRPGWSTDAMLEPSRFKDLLSVVKLRRCLVVVLVDLFDFHGSLLPSLSTLIGNNPLLVIANKIDLFPESYSELRIKSWIKKELENPSVGGLDEVNTNDIYLVSANTGAGVNKALQAMKDVCMNHRRKDIYVLGAANVGKSSFINRLLESGSLKSSKKGNIKTKNKKKGNSKDKNNIVTTSNVPGTTLNFIQVDLGGGLNLYDTPGLLVPHQITSILNTNELNNVLPSKKMQIVTVRVGEGKSVLLGGLCRLDLTKGKPFLFTFFLSNDIKIHPTSTDKSIGFLKQHVGSDLIYPPEDEERLDEIMSHWTERKLNIKGEGWKTSTCDIVLSGLGWISVTGALDCEITIMAPKEMKIKLREPLMPYETWSTASKYTGGKFV